MEERIRIIIEGEHKTATQSVGAVKGGLTGLGTVAAGVASGGLLLAAGAIAGIGTAAAGAGVAALNMAQDVNGATNTIATQLGISQDAASEWEGVMKGIFANNFGEDFDDIGRAISEVVRVLGEDISDEELQKVTEQAFALRDAFDIDINQSMGAVRTLMENFGLTSQEALDFVTKGLQDIPADDLLESITEYGPQFRDMKLGADEFFSAMVTGAQDGVLGTDKVLDMFKEMRLKLADLEGATGDALVELGEMSGAFDGQALIEDLQAGRIGMDEYFALIQEGLKGVDNEHEVTRLGAQLLGTQFEDMGSAAALAVDLAATSMEDLAGATDTLNAQYDNFGAMWEGIKRQALLALEPMGQALLDLGQSVMPLVTDFMENTLKPALETVGAFINERIVPAIENLKGGAGDLSAVTPIIEAFKENFARVKDTVMVLAGFFTGVVLPAIKGLIEFLKGPAAVALQIWMGLWQTQVAIITTVINVIVQVVTFLVDRIKAGWEVVKAAFDESNLGEALGELKQAFVDLWTALQPVFAGIGEIIVTNFETLKEVMGDVFGGTGEAVDWGGILVNIFNVIAKNVTTLANIIGTVAKAISAFWEAHGETIIKVATTAYKIQATIIGTALKVIIAVVKFFLKLFSKDWTKALKDLNKLITGFWKFVTNLFTSTVKALLRLIEGWLDDIVRTMQRAWDKVMDLIKDAWDFIDRLIDTVTAAILATIRSWLDTLERVIDNALNAIENTWESIWNGIRNFTQNILNTIENIFESVLGAIEDIVDDALDAIESTFESVLNAVRNLVNTILDQIESAFESALNAIEGIVDDALDAIEDIFDTGLNTVRNLVTTILNTIEDAFDNALAAIEDIVGDAFDDIEDIVDDAMGAIRNIVQSGWDTVNNVVNNAFNAMRDAAESGMNAVRDVVNNALQALASLMNVGSAAYNAVRGIGQSIVEVIIAGVQAVGNFVSSVSNQLTAWLNSVKVAMLAAGSAARSLGSGIVDAVRNGLTSVTTFVTNVANAFTNWIGQVLNRIGGLAQLGRDILAEIMNSLINNIGSWLSSFSSAIEDFIDDAICAVIGCSPRGSITDRLMLAGGKIMATLLAGVEGSESNFARALTNSIARGLMGATGNAGGLNIPISTSVGDLGLNGFNLANLGGVGVNSAGVGKTVIYHISPRFETTINDKMDKEEFITEVKDAIEEIVDREG